MSVGKQHAVTAKMSARGVKGMKAVHQKHGSGDQTKHQLTAERANLAKARATLATEKGWASAGAMWATADQLAAQEFAQMAASLYGGVLSHTKRFGIRLYTTDYRQLRTMRRDAFRTTTYHTLRTMRRKALQTTTETRSGSATMARQLHFFSRHPLGVRLLGSSLYKNPIVRKPTGVNHHFPQRIAAGGFMRSGWGNSRRSHFRKRLFIRKPRVSQVKKWRRSRGTAIAR